MPRIAFLETSRDHPTPILNGRVVLSHPLLSVQQVEEEKE